MTRRETFLWPCATKKNLTLFMKTKLNSLKIHSREDQNSTLSRGKSNSLTRRNSILSTEINYFHEEKPKCSNKKNIHFEKLIKLFQKREKLTPVEENRVPLLSRKNGIRSSDCFFFLKSLNGKNGNFSRRKKKLNSLKRTRITFSLLRKCIARIKLNSLSRERDKLGSLNKFNAQKRVMKKW